MFLHSKTFTDYLTFQSFDFERSWWKVWTFLMKGLSVPDERFERSWGKVWAFLMKGLSVPDERFERSWWKVISEAGLAHYILYLRFFLAILLLLFILNGFSLHHICYFIEILICLYYCISCMYLICYLQTIVLTKVTRNKDI